MGGSESPRPVSNPVLSRKDVSCSRDVRTGVSPAAAAGCHCCCDSRAGFRGWKSQISKEVVGLSRRNQAATHEMLKEEGSRYAPYISRGSRELSSSSDCPSFSVSSGKSKDMVLVREGFCLNERGNDKEERIAYNITGNLF